MGSMALSGIVPALLLSCAVLAQSASSPSHATVKADAVQASFDRYFARLDRDRDGFLSHDEAAGSKWLIKQFDLIDTDRDGKLGKGEMLAYRGVALRKCKAKSIEARFAAADRDGDHALSRKEAEASDLPHVGKYFDDIDMNKDGAVTLDELQKYLRYRFQTGPMA